MYGKFDWEEADRAPVPSIRQFVAARNQPLLESSAVARPADPVSSEPAGAGATSDMIRWDMRAYCDAGSLSDPSTRTGDRPPPFSSAAPADRPKSTCPGPGVKLHVKVRADSMIREVSPRPTHPRKIAEGRSGGRVVLWSSWGAEELCRPKPRRKCGHFICHDVDALRADPPTEKR